MRRASRAEAVGEMRTVSISSHMSSGSSRPACAKVSRSMSSPCGSHRHCSRLPYDDSGLSGGLSVTLAAGVLDVSESPFSHSDSNDPVWLPVVECEKERVHKHDHGP